MWTYSLNARVTPTNKASMYLRALWRDNIEDENCKQLQLTPLPLAIHSLGTLALLWAIHRANRMIQFFGPVLLNVRSRCAECIINVLVTEGVFFSEDSNSVSDVREKLSSFLSNRQSAKESET